ncbi:MAG TPA: glycosyl hydrolase family 28 protein [Rariglobus sp.]
MIASTLSDLLSSRGVARHLFTPQDFGACADGVALDTEAIQRAVDAAAAARGTVYFPPGRYVSGTVHLRSNLHLELASGAVLEGSLEREDYQRLPEPEDAALRVSEYYWYALLLGHDVENVFITGRGVLDGNGAILADNLAAYYPRVGPQRKVDERFRPVLINLVGCRNCGVSGLRLINPASWTQAYVHCTGLRLENLDVEGVSAWNNDGLDLCGCRDVIICGCRINAADDGICLKSSGRAVENVTISDCIIRSSASGIKFGTASARGFFNITVSNITIYDTARSGITLQIVDGGSLEQVTFTNISMRNVGNAIYLRVGDRRRGNAAHGRVGSMRQVVISNVVAEITGADCDAAYPFRAPRPEPRLNPLPCALVGLPGACIEDVVLSNLRFTFRSSLCAPARVVAAVDVARVPESAADYPEYDQFGELPAWGFFLRHARGITMRDVHLRLEGHDVRPAILCDDVENLRIEGVGVHAPEGARAIYHSVPAPILTPVASST